jgi:thiol-disulfide isomerase/thioredoxin
METLTLFYLRFCPYCRNAKRALAQLAEEENVRDLAVAGVDEAEDRALADRYDYYYVPSLFAGERKLYEAEPGESYEACKARLKAALDEVLPGR